MYKFLSTQAIAFIKSQQEITTEQEEIIFYGAYIVFLNITKLAIVYSLAFVLSITYEVFLINIGFTLLRVVAHGYHAKNSITCTLFMLGGFYSLAYFGIYLPYNKIFYLIILPSISLLLILKFAPSPSKNNPIKTIAQHKKKKKQSFICYIITYLTALLIGNQTIITMIILGMFLESLTIIKRR